jgi:GNAT superfamily N-acetyltransferase
VGCCLGRDDTPQPHQIINDNSDAYTAMERQETNPRDSAPIRITDSGPDDVFGIRRVQRLTWLDTYPNPALGITWDDIAARFAGDDTEEGRRRLEVRKRRYADPHVHTWVATEDDDIVGFCTARREGDTNRIEAIYVLPSHQSCGIGRRLMERALTWLGDALPIRLNVASYNEKAIRFYESLGFVNTRQDVIDDEVAPLPSGARIPETEMVRVTH